MNKPTRQDRLPKTHPVFLSSDEIMDGTADLLTLRDIFDRLIERAVRHIKNGQQILHAYAVELRPAGAA